MYPHMPRKKLLLFLIPLLMLACKTLFPEPAPKQPPISAPTRAALKTSTPRPSSSQNGFTIVRLEPGNGNLPDLLAAEAQKAAALGQMPVVEFDAPW